MIFTLLGWVGAFILIFAFFQVTRGKLSPSSNMYQYLNILASLFLLVSSYKIGAWFAVTLNGFWLAVSLYGIINVYLKKKNNK